MGPRVRTLHALLLACTLSACNASPQTPAPSQEKASEVLTPAVVAVREAVQTVVKPEVTFPPASPVTTSLIIRWEVSSPALYTRLYQHPLWPGESSGVTIGIGYDLGYNTSFQIGTDWSMHPQVVRLQTASGIVGVSAKNNLSKYKDIITPYPMADSVFQDATLPKYVDAARRALGPKFDQLSEGARAALVSVGYNRGWSFAGTRRREMRTIRDVCVPELSNTCIAAQLRSMKRLWPDSKGLRDRREDEARVAEEQ